MKHRKMIHLLIFSIIIFGFIQHENASFEEKDALLPTAAQTVIIENCFQGYAYHHAANGYDGEVNDKIHVGRDFDFFNEKWRGFAEFDISGIPDTATITALSLRIYISGKPKVSDNQRAQIGFFPMHLQPSQMSYDFEALFTDCGNGTQYIDGDLHTLTETGYYPSNTTWITFGNSSKQQLQESLTEDWYAIGFTDYYIPSLGHDSDQDEGIVCEVAGLEITYTINLEEFSASYTGDIDINGDTDTSSNDSELIAIILIVFMLLIGIVCIVFRKKFEKPTENEAQALFKPKNLLSHKENEKISSRKKKQEEKNQLRKFREILEISQRVKIADVATSLGIGYDDLFEKLLKWNRDIPFKIDGEMIVVENMGHFINALDEEFQHWETEESTEEGKI